MNNSYQVIARRYRPQTFADVLGQEAIVTTLKNAIRLNRTANAYLFSGSRGTGKTTLARLLAKALNCSNLNNEIEPCNQCPSCKEIASGYSLDVIEIDGASNRGIDDIRQINETVGYASAGGKFKVYIIDEVHMLTKEAFNALLKTLEEPPPNVKFIFATTESHKVLPTILSRCQRFNLNRIPIEAIVSKLHRICQEVSAKVEEEALQLIAQRAEGGLRDAESLLDQMLAFHGESLSAANVADLLGIMPRDILFTLDSAGKEGNYGVAFEIAQQLFSQGKDLVHFVESLMDHFRTILVVKVCGPQSTLAQLSASDRQRYVTSAALYQPEQCLWIIDTLIAAQARIRTLPSPRIALEALLLEILRSHQRVTLPQLIRRLQELEERFSKETLIAPASKIEPLAIQQPIEPTLSHSNNVKEEAPVIKVTEQIRESVTESIPVPAEAAKTVSIKQEVSSTASTQITVSKPTLTRSPYVYDTLLSFAAVELEGSIQRRPKN